MVLGCQTFFKWETWAINKPNTCTTLRSANLGDYYF